VKSIFGTNHRWANQPKDAAIAPILEDRAKIGWGGAPTTAEKRTERRLVKQKLLRELEGATPGR